MAVICRCLLRLEPLGIDKTGFIGTIHRHFAKQKKITLTEMPPKRKSDADGESTKAKKAKDQPTLKKQDSSVSDSVSSQDYSSEAKTKDGKSWNLKIASWNINGIRAWVKSGGHTYLDKEAPDILCVQEIKCPETKLPKEVNINGYNTYWQAADKPGYAGTGIYSKNKAVKVTYGLGIEKHDNEGRVITAEYEDFYLVTAYIPNSGRGLVRLDYRTKEWDEDFIKYLKGLDEKKPVILCGDLNVAHKEIDLANPKSNYNKTAGFTQAERDQFSSLLEQGFVDTFRELYPEETGAYSFWTYMGNARAKNVGWRLDYFVVSKRLTPKVCDSLIRKDVLGSDHCPIVLLLAM